MNVNGQHFRTIWVNEEDDKIINVINQTKLPFQFEIVSLKTWQEAADTISNMLVRGAGLIGATAGFAMYLAALDASTENYSNELLAIGEKVKRTRPTAVNLQWAVDRMLKLLPDVDSKAECIESFFQEAIQIANDDADMCKNIGQYGLKLIREISENKAGETVNILTHCNAGWLAFVDHGSATSPIYAAFDAGIDIHVWVDETRPRNQGARLTAWELHEHGIPHTIIPDNSGGHLMQHGLVDIVITGADRVTGQGDAANKIGTYLKALAAKDNKIPFYVALPTSTFDMNILDGVMEIPIEQRDGREVSHMEGVSSKNRVEEVRIIPEGCKVANYGFDVTPARLISGLITEKGICAASRKGISSLFS